MKIDIINLNNEKTKQIELPNQFNEQIREDIIKRAVEAIDANSRQKYGAKKGAGMRHSADLSRRRRKYRGSYGLGISRVPRKILSRRGTRMNWVGANAPGTVGGREAHPPKPSKEWSKKINKKERKLAIRSAISATIINDMVKQRGHILPNNYPIVIDNKFEDIKKTKEAEDFLKKIGLDKELERVSEKKIRPGKGKSRGRRYKTKKGPLIVVKNKDNKAIRNIMGVDVIKVNELNAKLLAPGAVPGRMTLWTEEAVNELSKKKLFC
jgi:large subunit ribosomal protein L4e